MADSFFTGTDAELYAGSSAFSAKITADPTEYGLVEAQATAYASLNGDYAEKYLAALDPEQRTKGKVAAKNAAKTVLKAMAADLAAIIDATPGVTDEMRIDLGLNVRKTPTPAPVPTESPNLEVIERFGTTVRIKLHDGTGSRRGKPPYVQGASVFRFVGAQPPVQVGEWQFWGITTKTSVNVEFDAELTPGTVVWFTAFWYNPRGESGPGCAPVSTNIAGGAMQQAA